MNNLYELLIRKNKMLSNIKSVIVDAISHITFFSKYFQTWWRYIFHSLFKHIFIIIVLKFFFFDDVLILVVIIFLYRFILHPFRNIEALLFLHGLSRLSEISFSKKMLLLVSRFDNQGWYIVFINKFAYLFEAHWTLWVAHQFLILQINFFLLEYTLITCPNPLDKIQLDLKTFIGRSSYFSISFLLGFDHLQKIIDMSRTTHFKQWLKLYLISLFILYLWMILNIWVMNNRDELLIDCQP